MLFCCFLPKHLLLVRTGFYFGFYSFEIHYRWSGSTSVQFYSISHGNYDNRLACTYHLLYRTCRNKLLVRILVEQWKLLVEAFGSVIIQSEWLHCRQATDGTSSECRLVLVCWNTKQWPWHRLFGWKQMLFPNLYMSFSVSTFWLLIVELLLNCPTTCPCK